VIEHAAAVADRQPEIARRATELVFERMPELAGAYGPGGRHKCEEDAGFHVRFLLAGIAIEDTTVFEEYARWTRDLLDRYEIPPSHLAAAFRALGDALDELVPAAAPAARVHLDAGEAALGD
jgi:hypothetical protein